jgi:hypothetical protein
MHTLGPVITRTYLSESIGGRFMYDSSDKEVMDSERAQPELVAVGDRSDSFRFYQVTEVTVDGEVLRGSKKYVGPTYWPGGKLHTTREAVFNSILAGLLEMMGEADARREADRQTDNVVFNITQGKDVPLRVVESRSGRMNKFNEGDIIL